MAHKSHVSLTSLSLIEAGLRNPSLETVYRIAEGLAVSVYYLIPGIHDDADLLRSLDMTAWAMSAQSQLEALADLESIIGHLDDIANH
ncbi:helix-turn-helix transcriptional regulator (plasmid) [Komagataeibacter oboediens]|uniref:helix-turn-helix domain-containing protein n=1 Tax=Komagataeibacter oboediens TaxID=65958 RepID=UPI0023DAF9DE|nr:helix-turn-helix transcriptional regulator [Komagataeibacter oboediens]WEQ50731.1 helix-turn-helix transcriptional regulator [Komagataeibacter oboediens]